MCFLTYKFIKKYRSRESDSNFLTPAHYLRTAIEMLEDEGYRVLDKGASVSLTTIVDGRPSHHVIQPDLIAQKEGCRYVVLLEDEGRQLSATKAKNRYLEHYFLYQPDGIILLDTVSGGWHFIDFEIEESYQKLTPKRMLWGYLITIALGAIFALWFM